MKSTKIIITLICSLAFAAASYSQKDNSKGKVFYINNTYVISNYTKTSTLKELLEQYDKNVTAQIDSLQNILKREEPKFKTINQDPTFNEESRAKYSQWIYGVQSMISNLQTQQQNGYSGYITNFQNQLNAELNAYINDYAKSKNIYMILGALGNGNVMFADESANLSEEILEGLNRQYEDSLDSKTE